MNNAQIPGPDGMNMNVDLATLPTLTCRCGSVLWFQTTILKEVSALTSPTGEAGIVPVPADMFCLKCKTSLTEIAQEHEANNTKEESSIIV